MLWGLDLEHCLVYSFSESWNHFIGAWLAFYGMEMNRLGNTIGYCMELTIVLNEIICMYTYYVYWIKIFWKLLSYMATLYIVVHIMYYMFTRDINFREVNNCLFMVQTM